MWPHRRGILPFLRTQQTVHWSIRVVLSQSSYARTPSNRGYQQSFHYQLNSVSVIVPYPSANNERIIVGVVKTSSIFLRKPNYGAVDPCHLWNETWQLDVLKALRAFLDEPDVVVPPTISLCPQKVACSYGGSALSCWRIVLVSPV